MKMGAACNAVLTVILFLKYIPDPTSAIKCFKCTVAVPMYYTKEPIRLCKDFDYSDNFIVDCPYSTFCMKKISTARIPVPINGVERDCALQKLETQEYTNGKWHPLITIEEPYTEGCATQDDKGARTSIIEHCYCRGDLCNFSHRIIVGKWQYCLTALSLWILNHFVYK